jgi:hypothetical protein
MLSTVLAVSWQPELRGILVVVVMVLALIGSTYLILGTNLGARLGFLVTATALAGWMMCMAVVWAIYGIGLMGPLPSWEPAQPITIVRDAGLLDAAGVLEFSPSVDDQMTPAAAAEKVAELLKAEGWIALDESDPRRGQAVAASDAIIQIDAEEFGAGEYATLNVYDRGGERWPKIGESIDFVAFRHEPRYALVEIAPLLPQRDEPGRAPARPVIDENAPHRYVLMIRDLGAHRRPAVLIAIGSALVFFVLARVLHRRETILRENLALTAPKG